jgi:hypothetical protein
MNESSEKDPLKLNVDKRIPLQQKQRESLTYKNTGTH